MQAVWQLAGGIAHDFNMEDPPFSSLYRGEEDLDGKDLSVCSLVIPLEAMASVPERDLDHLVRLLEGRSAIGLRWR